MEITRNKKAYNEFIITGVTEGKLMSMWHGLEQQRVAGTLTPVDFDVWLQLNRQMEEIAPQFVVVKGR